MVMLALVLISWILIVPFSAAQITTPSSKESPCLNYRMLKSKTRSRTHVTKQSSDGDAECDRTLKRGWYRFTGDAGTKMAETPVETFRCGAHSPGWLRGGHPNISQGIVNRTACFTWFFNDNCYGKRDVSVVNCSGFYVYNLQPTSLCDLRYCGDGVPAPPLACVPGNTSHDIDGTIPGEITSPSYPNPYPHNQDCSWLIKAPLGSLVRVTLFGINLRAGDLLVMADGDRDRSVDIGRYSHCAKGSISLLSSGNSMLIRFISNDEDSASGFKLTYKTVRRDILVDAGNIGPCTRDTIMRGTFGYIGHIGFPNPVPGMKRCLWSVKVPEGKKVFFKFHWMGLHEREAMFCEKGWVRLSLTGRSGSVMHCGCDVLPVEISGDNNGYVQFMSLKEDFYSGFLLEYRALDDADCPGGKAESCKLKDNMDVGVDRFGRVKYEPDNVPSTFAPTTEMPTDTQNLFHVSCDQNQMEVILDVDRFPGLEYSKAHLNEDKCTAYSTNAVQIRMRTTLDGCGTKHNYSSDGTYIIYHNNIIMNKVVPKEKEDKNKVITRDHQAYFAFSCKYHRRMVLTVVHFSPSFTFVSTKQAFGFGNFSYSMAMYKSERYESAYNKYPVYIRSNYPVYLEVAVTSNDTDLVLFADTCYATPSKDPDDKQRYTFLEEGCARDETLDHKYKLSPVQRFNLKAFYFETFRTDEVYLHCEVLVCQRSDKKSRCTKGCPYQRRRRRETGIEYQTTQQLTVGPIRWIKNGDNKIENSRIDRGAREDSRTYIVEIVAGSLGFVALVLVVSIIYVVFKPKHDQSSADVLIVKEGTDY
ncbi:uncharacterized protein LOC5507923 isoform X1 [Nematostella vectensis]|uniref:uncharacterized protein LOC5507923 isoform X1 n=1 Tax=Nematostella vectensis TaxID=45351 RepID=UPI00207758B1|nr:uncharacterized protein LOC5507923 isoform X1 [Nematostella vectensis]